MIGISAFVHNFQIPIKCFYSVHDYFLSSSDFRNPKLQTNNLKWSFSADKKAQIPAMVNIHILLSISSTKTLLNKKEEVMDSTTLKQKTEVNTFFIHMFKCSSHWVLQHQRKKLKQTLFLFICSNVSRFKTICFKAKLFHRKFDQKLKIKFWKNPAGNR